MKTKFPLAFYYLLILCLSGCSIDLAQPATSTPFSEVLAPSPTSPPNVNPSGTTIPITWASLNLTGRLIYASTPITGESSPISIQTLDFTTGEMNTLFTGTDDAWVFYISVSPDAKQLVMSYIPGSTSSNRALYILPLDGASPPQLFFPPPTPDDHYVQAEWSPDGKYIYYTHYNKNNQPLNQPFPNYDLFRMKYPDDEPEKIADHAFWPRLSADSSKLVYVHVDPDEGTNELFVANADGSNPQKVPLSSQWGLPIIDAPIFSPDGSSILFSAPAPAQAYQPNWLDKLTGVRLAKAHNIPSDWWYVPITGGVPTRLTKLQTINLYASISPDHKHLASVSGEGLFVMDWDGSNLTQILFNPAISSTVNWLP
jgi:Tol biopolymer transport system component